MFLGGASSLVERRLVGLSRGKASSVLSVLSLEGVGVEPRGCVVGRPSTLLGPEGSRGLTLDFFSGPLFLRTTTTDGFIRRASADFSVAPPVI
jgi:hypothetical protein